MDQQEFKLEKEICRKDGRDKFLVFVDNTNYDGVYNYILNVPVDKRISEKVKEPYNKVGLRLIVYSPETAKCSLIQYIDVDDFFLFVDKVMKIRPLPETMKSYDLHEFMGFSQKSGTVRTLKVVAMNSIKDKGKLSFSFSFSQGKGIASADGRGFKWDDKTPKTQGNIVLPEDEIRKMLLDARSHLDAVRIASVNKYIDRFKN